MARPRMTMKTQREILRHALDLKLSGNETQAILNASRGTVQNCIKRAKAANLNWQQIELMSDEELSGRLYPEKEETQKTSHGIDWEKVYAESKRRAVMLRLLYEEQVERDGLKLSYSQFCRLFRQWAREHDISMRQEHVAGEKLFIDFSGMTVRLTNPETGEVSNAQIFVATFGASNYTYFEAVESQKLQNWIEAHIRAFKFFGGLPKLLVPDNLKSAVIDADKFDPILNRTYQRFAAHYRVGIKPARPARPKDKAKVEKGVQNTEYRALAKIRDRTFFNLNELNRELKLLIEETNDAPFQKLSGSRRSWFEDVDKPALRPLPLQDFEFEEWIVGYRVPSDYHVNVLGHHYSVPFLLAHKIVDVRFTKFTVEILHGNTRIASHVRSWAEGAQSTASEHLAPTHAVYHGLTSEYFLEQGAQIGPNAKNVIQTLLNAKPYPQLSYSECFGLVKTLKNSYGDEEVELACAQAIRLNSVGYRVVKYFEGWCAKHARPTHTSFRKQHTREPSWCSLLSLGEKMLKHPTIDKLEHLKLTGMLRALESQSQLQNVEALSFEDRLAMLIDAEFSERDTTEFTKRLKSAKLRDAGCVEDIDFKGNRNIDKRLVAQLAEGSWLNEHRNILVTGKTGVGKTFMTCALGQKACRLGHTVLYYRAPRFFQELTVARLKNTYQTILTKLKRTKLLILDDFALVPISEEQCRDMLEVTDDRTGCGSLIISSQLPVKEWYQTSANATLADAILDRVVHGSYRLELGGPTRRGLERSEKE